MNILIVSQYFWPEIFNINGLAKDLTMLGHEVTVLTGKPNYPSGKFNKGYSFFKKNLEYYSSIKIIRSPIFSRGEHSKIKLILNYLSFIFFGSITGIFKCKKPDVIFVYEPSPITVCLPALVLKIKFKSPLMIWVQDLWPESVIAVGAIKNKIILTILNKLVYYIYKGCDCILVTSRSYFHSIKKYSVPNKKLYYFPQTADHFYKPIDPNLCLFENKKMPCGFRIIFAGNIGVAQNMEIILNAATILKEDTIIKWIIIGDGSRRHWLQKEISERNLTHTIHWIGSHPPERMPYYFSAADALLLTLKSDPVFSLTIPAKLQSYLACAKPILAALDGEAQKIIEEAQAGFVVSTGNAEALATIVAKMKNLSIDSRKKMGLNGRKYYEKHFCRDLLLKNLQTWMHELTEKL